MGDIKSYLTVLDRVQAECAQANKITRSTWRYQSYEGLVLALGKEFTWAPLPRRMKYRTPRLCFMNAHRLASRNDRLIPYVYCEGWAVRHGVPVHHAWCLDPHNRVVDPTWQIEEGEPRPTYFGIACRLPYVLSASLCLHRYGLFYPMDGRDQMLSDDPKEYLHERMLTACS